MRLDTTHARQAATALGDHGADLAALHARLAADGAARAQGDRPWGSDRLGAAFGAAYAGTLDAVLALVGALSDGACSTARDLARMAAGTEHADASAAAAFPRSAG